MTIRDLDTPALLVDLDRMESNLDRAATYADRHGLHLRPHTKTHKSPRIGDMQLARGACGLTVAKVSEAEVMARSSTPDLLLAYPLWGDLKWARLACLAKDVRVTVALDNAGAAEGIHRHAAKAGVTVGILVEADLGMRRCGLPPGERLLELARAITTLASLRLEGLMFYPGHVNPAGDGGRDALARVASDLEGILSDFRRDGLPADVVSGGSTPTLYHSHRLPGLTEIRPGTYVFNDRTQVAMGACDWDDCALAVLVTVVSTARVGAAVIDGGSKTFTSDPVRLAKNGGHGRVVGMTGIRFARMSEEHGVLDLSEHDGPSLRVGQRLRIIPNHACVTVNMHETVHGCRGRRVEESWPVAGRGKLQ